MDLKHGTSNIVEHTSSNKDDGHVSIITDETESDLQPYSTFRERLYKRLHSQKFQIIVISLVIFDCLLVIGELMIDLEIVVLHEDHHVVPHVLHYLSIVILSIFLVEIAAKLYAFRLEFFHHKLEVFDAIVVILSFSLDIAFIDTVDVRNGTGLLIILRLWRVARILNGIVLSVKTQAEHKLMKERQLREAVEEELSKCREYCTALEKEIESLRVILKDNKITELPPTVMDKPAVHCHTISVVAEVNSHISNDSKNDDN